MLSQARLTRLKFMLSLHDPVATELQELADKKNCSIQDLIRVIIIPEWKEQVVMRETR